MGMPEIDNLSKNLNKITPSKIENLAPTSKKSIIDKSISLAKGEICNKIDGVLNVVSSIKSGASNILNAIGNVNLDPAAFFEGPIQGLKDKLGNITKVFDQLTGDFKLQDISIGKILNEKLDKLLEQQIERVESVKIAAQGFENPMKNITNLSNTKLRDIGVSDKIKQSLSNGFCGEAEKDLADSALTQKSVKSEVEVQDKKLVTNNEEWENFNADEMFDETGIIKPNANISPLTSTTSSVLPDDIDRSDLQSLPTIQPRTDAEITKDAFADWDAIVESATS